MERYFCDNREVKVSLPKSVTFQWKIRLGDIVRPGAGRGMCRTDHSFGKGDSYIFCCSGGKQVEKLPVCVKYF
jgi:hypothetical protein